MKIFEDILDDIDLNDNNDDQSSIIAKLGSSNWPADTGRYDFVLYVGFYLGCSYFLNDDMGNDIKQILNSKEEVYRRNCSNYFKKIENYLNVYTDEYWTDGLLYTIDGSLLSDLTKERIKDITLQNKTLHFFYANKVYYIKFDNNYHHLLKFLYFYTNYSYGDWNTVSLPLNQTLCCIPYKEVKEYDDINSMSRALKIQSDIMQNDILKYKRFFVDSFVFRQEEMNKRKLSRLSRSVENSLIHDSKNIYRYFYLDYNILKVLDNFKTEEERLDFIKDQIWKLKLRNIKK